MNRFELLKAIRRKIISLMPATAEKAGRFYVHCIMPFLPVKIFAARKMIGDYGPFLFHPRFLFRDFSRWGIEKNFDFKASVEESRGKKCFLDIGAHIGLVSIPISAVLAEGGVVYAFEPADFDRHYLAQNITVNKIKNIKVQNFLVGREYRKNVEFFQQADESGVSSVVINNKRPEKYIKKFKTQISIDKFCAIENVVPDVIKIDAEGNEFDILEGAGETLRKYKPVIFISLHGGHLEKLGRNISEVTGIADALGYNITHVDRSPVPPDKFRTEEYVMRSKG